MIESMLGAKPAVTTLPIGSEDNFQGVIDLVAMKAITWTGEVRCALSCIQNGRLHPLMATRDVVGILAGVRLSLDWE